jgi:3-phenylpropionate/trans-cinnamate dioxygenase ferredoxin reductase subunit
VGSDSDRRAGSRPVVIVGGGLAGGNATVALREAGYQGRLALIGREPGVPFGRPPLSKTYLRGEEDLDAWYVRTPAWYEEHTVELMTGSALASVDSGAGQVRLESGQVVPYRALLLTTGGRNRKMKVAGSGLQGVHQLRTVAECDAIKRAAVPGRHAVVVGMGFIGCEVAASLRQIGVRVTAILKGSLPLEAALGKEAGAVIAAVHREEGVEIRAQDEVVAFEGDGRLQEVVTARGSRISCDLAVVGVGIEPEIPTVEGAGLAVNNGILVDELCRTNLPNVYAAGDVANHLHPLFGRIRVEHYNNAEKHGKAAALSLLGRGEPYSYLHTFWSDQYSHKLEYVGHAASWDRFLIRGSVEERRFIGFYLRGGVVRAALGFDRGGDPELDEDGEMAACARLVARGARIPEDRLIEESVELSSLATATG